MFCSSCGRALPDNSKFRTGCGKPVSPPRPIQETWDKKPAANTGSFAKAAPDARATH